MLMVFAVPTHFVSGHDVASVGRNELAACGKKLDELFRGHVICRTGVKAGFRAKALNDGGAERGRGVSGAGLHHHLHNFVAVDRIIHNESVAANMAVGLDAGQIKDPKGESLHSLSR